MTSQDRVRAALSHRPPDFVPMDFGSTGVTGMHVSCVAALRDYFGLERHPVKRVAHQDLTTDKMETAHEPYQMLGFIEDDLQTAMGLDVEGVFPRQTLFGFANHGWKSWRMPDGLEVLVSRHFRNRIQCGGPVEGAAHAGAACNFRQSPGGSQRSARHRHTLAAPHAAEARGEAITGETTPGSVYHRQCNSAFFD